MSITADNAELAQVLGNGIVWQVTIRGEWSEVADALQRIVDREAAGTSPSMLADDARLLADALAHALMEAGQGQGLLS